MPRIQKPALNDFYNQLTRTSGAKLDIDKLVSIVGDKKTFGITTTEFQKQIPTQPSRRDQTLLPHVTGLNGGVPIKLGNDVIAGVGVAGSPGKDEECASAGLEKVRQALQ